jgi:pilus assembly protein Flp/PilA
MIVYLSVLAERLPLWLQALTHDEDGQDLAEYALLLVFIAIVVIAALTALGPQLAAVYAQISAALTGAGGS